MTSGKTQEAYQTTSQGSQPPSVQLQMDAGDIKLKKQHTGILWRIPWVGYKITTGHPPGLWIQILRPSRYCKPL